VVIAVAERDFHGVGEDGEESEYVGEEEKEIHGEGCGLVVASKDCSCLSERPLLRKRQSPGCGGTSPFCLLWLVRCGHGRAWKSW